MNADGLAGVGAGVVGDRDCYVIVARGIVGVVDVGAGFEAAGITEVPFVGQDVIDTRIDGDGGEVEPVAHPPVAFEAVGDIADRGRQVEYADVPGQCVLRAVIIGDRQGNWIDAVIGISVADYLSVPVG